MGTPESRRTFGRVFCRARGRDRSIGCARKRAGSSPSSFPPPDRPNHSGRSGRRPPIATSAGEGVVMFSRRWARGWRWLSHRITGQFKRCAKRDRRFVEDPSLGTKGVGFCYSCSQISRICRLVKPRLGCPGRLFICFGRPPKLHPPFRLPCGWQFVPDRKNAGNGIPGRNAYAGTSFTPAVGGERKRAFAHARRHTSAGMQGIV